MRSMVGGVARVGRPAIDALNRVGHWARTIRIWRGEHYSNRWGGKAARGRGRPSAPHNPTGAGSTYCPLQIGVGFGGGGG